MQSTLSLHALDDLTDDERDTMLSNETLHSLAEVRGAIPDPRSAHGKTCDFPFLLTSLAPAFLYGYDSTDAASQWCREHHSLVRQDFGKRRHLTHSGALYRRLLPCLPAAHFEWALAS